MKRESEERKREREREGIERIKRYYEGVLDKSSEIVESLKAPLPSTFRVCPGMWKEEIEKELKKNSLVEKVKWSTGIYKLRLSRKEISMRGIKENVHNLEEQELLNTNYFLKTYASSSYVTRQEAVSMIPVVALEVEKDSVVLDMCASPGSKSSQILESLGENGVLVCNDINRKRIDRLVKQTKRFGHPGLIVTCSDASIFPSCGVSPDRVLCDVPCTGDGTIRKNKHIFQKWQIKESLCLFSTQRKILLRGIEILDTDGILVYSTCSLNPIENEVVVLSVLAERKDIDVVPFEIEGLVMQEGLSEERIKICIAKVQEEAKSLSQSNPSLKQLAFCYSYDKRIRNCRRVHPNDQDTGGFFIAKIRKRSVETRKNSSRGCRSNSLPQCASSLSQPLLIRGEKGKDSSIYYLDSELKKDIEDYWGECAYTLVAKTEHFKQAYAVSEKAMHVVVRASEALSIVYSGVRMFSAFGSSLRKENKSRWRVTYEGLGCFLPKNRERVIEVSCSELIFILETQQNEEVQSRATKNICVLSASGPRESSAIYVPFITSNGKIEPLVDKIQRQTLLDILKLFKKHNPERFSS